MTAQSRATCSVMDEIDPLISNRLDRALLISKMKKKFKICNQLGNAFKMLKNARRIAIGNDKRASRL